MPSALPGGGTTLCGVICAALIAGCGFDDPSRTYTSRVMSGGSADRVFAAGTDALRAEFGRLAESSPAGRKAVSAAVEFDTRRESGTGRDLYGNSTRMRRLATLVVDQRGSEVLARVRVDVERHDTTRTQQLQRPNSRFSDYPHDETAGERDAATTRDQNDVWVKARRDIALENELLRTIAQRFAPTDDGQTNRRAASSQPAVRR